MADNPICISIDIPMVINVYISSFLCDLTHPGYAMGKKVCRQGISAQWNLYKRELTSTQQDKNIVKRFLPFISCVYFERLLTNGAHYNVLLNRIIAASDRSLVIRVLWGFSKQKLAV